MTKICGLAFDKCGDLNDLKESTICDFKDLLQSVERGHRYNYDMILEKISLIQITEDFSMKKLDYFINYYKALQWEKTTKPY